MNNTITKQEKNRKKLLASGFVSFLFVPSLLLSSMNFGNKYFYFLFFCFAVLFLLGLPSFHINGMVFALFGLSISYLLFNASVAAYSITGILKQFVYPLSYICGLNCLKQFEHSKRERLTETDRQKLRERGFIVLICVIATGILVHILLNLYANPDPSDRTLIDFWTKDATSATGNAALLCFGIGIIPALLLNKSKLWGKLYAILSLTIFVIFALILAGRTFFLLFAIVFLATVLFSAYQTKSRKKAVRIILIAAIAVGLIALLFSKNVFGLQDAFMSSNFYDRFFGENAMDMGEDGRMERKLMYLENMFEWKNLWGGGALRAASNGKYAHELYLDLLSDAGVIAYVLCIIFVFTRTLRGLKFAFDRENGASPLTSAIIFGLFLSLNIEFFIEPIIQGMPWLFPTFCLLCGMIDYLIENKRKDAEN